jgi:predicted DNA-binding protein with PD1-like motif
MDYRRFGDTLVIRIDKGEEITEQLRAVAEKEEIRLAGIEALGAVNDFTVGVYNTAEKKYYSNHFEGAFEIVSLTGTITTKDGAFYQHLHMSAGDGTGKVFGGHLNRAVVSATCVSAKPATTDSAETCPATSMLLMACLAFAMSRLRWAFSARLASNAELASFCMNSCESFQITAKTT